MLVAIILAVATAHVGGSKLIQVPDNEPENSGAGLTTNEDEELITVDRNIEMISYEAENVKQAESKIEEFIFQDTVDKDLTTVGKKTAQAEDFAYPTTKPVPNVKSMKENHNSDLVLGIRYEFWINLAINAVGFIILLVGILLLGCKKTSISLHTGPTTLQYPDFEVSRLLSLEKINNECVILKNYISGKAQISGSKNESPNPPFRESGEMVE